ncbi:MAG: hypothetical protein KC910_26540 [Candidatus Eremiobacteraeota bacterium]|nr:hypothetical protein [Candidatus Eremiobacteraeota bacterium]
MALIVGGLILGGAMLAGQLWSGHKNRELSEKFMNKQDGKSEAAMQQFMAMQQQQQQMSMMFMQRYMGGQGFGQQCQFGPAGPGAYPGCFPGPQGYYA